MAKNNIEVEIKIPTTKKLFEKVKRHLKKNAMFISKTEEVDKYYNPTYLNFLKEKHPKQYLRVRLKSGKSYLTYKRIYMKGKDMTHADEFETEISNRKQLEKILCILSCKNFLNIIKKRATYHFRDDFEVELDIVKGLGYFVEIESLKDFGGNKKTLMEIYALANRLGLDPYKRNSDGYVLLLMKKKGLVN